MRTKTEKYNSILYGNGLTLHAFASVRQSMQKNDEGRAAKYLEYLDLTEFFEDLARMNENEEAYKEIFGEFLSFFPDLKNDQKYKYFLQTSIKKIRDVGLEHWMTRNIPSLSGVGRTSREDMGALNFYHALYNYWFYFINKHVLRNELSQMAIKGIAEKVQQHLLANGKYFSTNFDRVFDDVFTPDHLHGKFSGKASLETAGEIQGRYIFQFMCGGISEIKIANLELLKYARNVDDFYDLDFFKNDVSLGNLLIFGLGFVNNGTQGASDVHGRENERKLLSFSLDDHILISLSAMKRQKTLTSIDISYYDKNGDGVDTFDEVPHYQKLFQAMQLDDITSYIPASSIIK